MPTLDDYRKMVTCNLCRDCNVELPWTIEHYPHRGGWSVGGMEGRHWLYLTCPRCTTQWPLWKLGVPIYFVQGITKEEKKYETLQELVERVYNKIMGKHEDDKKEESPKWKPQ
jgi:hypothetical protein